MDVVLVSYSTVWFTSLRLICIVHCESYNLAYVIKCGDLCSLFGLSSRISSACRLAASFGLSCLTKFSLSWLASITGIYLPIEVSRGFASGRDF